MRVLPGWLFSNLVYFSYSLNGCIVCVSCGWHVLTWTSFNVTLNVYRYIFKTQQTMVVYLKIKHLKNARWLTGFHGGKENNDRGPIVSNKVIALVLLSLMRCCCWHRYHSLQLLVTPQMLGLPQVKEKQSCQALPKGFSIIFLLFYLYHTLLIKILLESILLVRLKSHDFFSLAARESDKSKCLSFLLSP